MTDQRDEVLQSLFALDKADLADQDGQLFTARVMAKTRKLVFTVVAVVLSCALALLCAAYIAGIPVNELARYVTQALATPLFQVENATLSWVLTPVNNIAGLLVVCLKLIRVIWKKSRRASIY